MKSPLALVGALMLTFASAQGVVITPTAINDAYSYKYGTDLIGYYEDAGTIGVQYFYNGDSRNTVLAAGFMEFSLDGISMPAGSKAWLNLYIISASKGTANSAGFINHVANSSAATGNALTDHIGGGELVYTVADGTSGWVSIDVTSYVQNDIDNGYSYRCFSMNYDTSGEPYDRNASYSFYSANSTTNSPYMVVPEPSICAAVAGFGSLALAFFAKRRRV